MENVIDENAIVNHTFSLGFSGFSPAVFIARTSLTCPGATWMGERQWARRLVYKLNNFLATDVALVYRARRIFHY